jgi:uncharacterized membrane protein
MTSAALAGSVAVPLFGALMCAAPAVTRPTAQFGVSIPPDHAGAPVIRRERRAYYWRSAVVAICCAAVALSLAGSGSRWLPRIVLLAQIAADAGCVYLARRKIIAAKAAEGWLAGRRQTIVADTSWRTEPRQFPVRWLLPAFTVIAVTIVIGAVRYPHLAGGLTLPGGRRVSRSPASVFIIVIGQLYVTALWTGLLALVYRSRPDIDPAEPAASLRRYRYLLGAVARAALAMIALIDVTFLLAGLRSWQLYQPQGISAALVLLPGAAGVLVLVVVAMRAGRNRARAAAAGNPPGRAAVVGRDDDRFWKAGLIYVNRSDPAVAVPVRIGVGWTLNLGNPASWLAVAGVITIVGCLAAIRAAAGL